MKKILYYHLDDLQRKVYPSIAKRLGYLMVGIDDTNLFQTIEELFNLEESNRGNCESYPLSFLIFQDTSNEELLILLDAFKTAHMPFLGIKVVRTPTNEKWILQQLLAETYEEHKVFQNAKLLDQLIRSANEIDLTQLSDTDQETFKHTLMDSYLLLKSGQFERIELEVQIQKMKDALMLAKKVVH